MWDRIIDVLKVAAIPITVALTGYFVQQAMQDDELRTERLKLAIGLLADKEAPPALKQFAVNLLQDSLPTGVTLERQLVVSLETGEVSFPLTLNDVAGYALLKRVEEDAISKMRELRMDYPHAPEN